MSPLTHSHKQPAYSHAHTHISAADVFPKCSQFWPLTHAATCASGAYSTLTNTGTSAAIAFQHSQTATSAAGAFHACTHSHKYSQFIPRSHAQPQPLAQPVHRDLEEMNRTVYLQDSFEIFTQDPSLLLLCCSPIHFSEGCTAPANAQRMRGVEQGARALRCARSADSSGRPRAPAKRAIQKQRIT